VFFFLLWIVNPCVGAIAGLLLFEWVRRGTFGGGGAQLGDAATLVSYGVRVLLTGWNAWLLFGFRRRFWLWIAPDIGSLAVTLNFLPQGLPSSGWGWVIAFRLIPFCRAGLLFGVRKRPALGLVAPVLGDLAVMNSMLVRDLIRAAMAIAQSALGISMPKYFMFVMLGGIYGFGTVVLGILLAWFMPPKDSPPDARRELSNESANA